jgi:hypothetical protein
MNLIFRSHKKLKLLSSEYETLPYYRTFFDSTGKVNGLFTLPSTSNSGSFLTNVFKGDDVYSFVHGFWYIGLMMVRKLVCRSDDGAQTGI